MSLPIGLDFAPMEGQIVRSLPTSGPYQFEPKWDGFRAICFRDGDNISIQSKSGQPLARYFPEVVTALRSVPLDRFVLDGEIVVPVKNRLDFDQLLQRIHPAASRVKSLAAAYPAVYMMFDLLVNDQLEPLYLEKLSVRRPALEKIFERFNHEPTFRLSAATTDRKIADSWYALVGGALDGIIAKRLDVPYSSGDRHGMRKIKRLRTADCVVAGYQLSNDGEAVGSLLLGLYDVVGNSLEYVGFTSGFSSQEKRSLLKRLAETRVARSFTGRSPGGQSRWNKGKASTWVPVDPKLVLEVEFDHVSGFRFRHGTRPVRFRPDKVASDCSLEQLQQPTAASAFTLSVIA
jgi:ATP-dependent DNA ligase